MKNERRRRKMFNLIKDEFDENSDDILETINKMLASKKDENKEEKENKEK
jgi:hypothetical protein